MVKYIKNPDGTKTLLDPPWRECVDEVKARFKNPDVEYVNTHSLEYVYPDPIERVEHLYGPKGRPYGHMSYPGWLADWNEYRLQIATDPEYMDRARESYAFQDLIGKEYNGVVFE